MLAKDMVMTVICRGCVGISLVYNYSVRVDFKIKKNGAAGG